MLFSPLRKPGRSCFSVHLPSVSFADNSGKVARCGHRLLLSQAGFQATAFDRPQKAIAARAGLTPALLISDVMMPGMTGVELAIHFRKAQPECKVLLFSGQASTADLLEKARAEGYDFDLLSKPIHPANLLAKLRV